ncbi:MAG: endolytic transglycosylase MltG [Flavobacteriales bacterium]|nr:endolytic transglycosylase MltG [Flavobacteriales bacterium]
MKNKVVILIVLIILTCIGVIVWAVSSPNSRYTIIYVKNGFNEDSLVNALKSNNCIEKNWKFDLSHAFLQIDHIIPGKYEVTEGLTNRELINLFKYGMQHKVSFRFGNNVLPHELFSLLGQKYESDSLSFAKAILNRDKLEALGLDSVSFLCMFWAESCEFNWSVEPEKFVDHFVLKQQKYWDAEKFNRLSKTGLKSVKEVCILASIVEKEAVKKEEMPAIAGVYLNRLKIGMPLQADPTVKYAAGINSMNRVEGILDTESPYNTYKVKGLPPGPIGLPTKEGIEAVLNFEESKYLYFVALADFSGYHHFSNSFAEHRRYAIRYRSALDKRGIKGGKDVQDVN